MDVDTVELIINITVIGIMTHPPVEFTNGFNQHKIKLKLECSNVDWNDMSDKEIAETLLAEGVKTAIKEQWVNPEDIEDDALRFAVLTATSAYDAFDMACSIAELEAYRINNDS